MTLLLATTLALLNFAIFNGLSLIFPSIEYIAIPAALCMFIVIGLIAGSGTTYAKQEIKIND